MESLEPPLRSFFRGAIRYPLRSPPNPNSRVIHGGAIGLKSEVGVGTTVEVHSPFEEEIA